MICRRVRKMTTRNAGTTPADRDDVLPDHADEQAKAKRSGTGQTGDPRPQLGLLSHLLINGRLPTA